MGKIITPFSMAALDRNASMVQVHKKALMVIMNESKALRERNKELQAGVDEAFAENQALLRIVKLAKDFMETPATEREKLASLGGNLRAVLDTISFSEQAAPPPDAPPGGIIMLPGQ